jgi:hypothetical protein
VLRSVCRSSTAFWRAFSASISARSVAMSLICASSRAISALQELVARLLRAGHLLQHGVPDAGDHQAAASGRAQADEEGALALRAAFPRGAAAG